MATPFKHPRTGVYYIRRAVPKDIRETFGKSEYLKSLGTKDEREAKVLFPAALQESDAAFARARGKNATIDVLNDVQIREVGEAWATHILGEDEEVRLDGVTDRDHGRTQETLEDVLSGLKADLARGRVDDGVAWEFDDFLKSYGFNVPTNTMNYRRVHMGMLRAWIRAMEGQLLRQQGEGAARTLAVRRSCNLASSLSFRLFMSSRGEGERRKAREAPPDSEERKRPLDGRQGTCRDYRGLFGSGDGVADRSPHVAIRGGASRFLMLDAVKVVGDPDTGRLDSVVPVVREWGELGDLHFLGSF